MDFWKLNIDTGGTFTDCIAYSPEGKELRYKVLSSSKLRARIEKIYADGSLSINTDWELRADVLQGYHFRLLHAEHWHKVTAFDAPNRLLRLETAPSPDWEGQPFELTAHEEAPIMAARLVTGMPLQQPLPPLEMRLGSTKGTNALLERKVAKTALLITEGLGDLLLIRDQTRPDLFALDIRKPLPLYHTVYEVPERLNAEGEVEKPLTEEAIQHIIHRLKKEKVEAVAVSLMHAYRNRVHEQQLQQRLGEAGFAYISCGSALANEIKILPRTETAVVNAALSPIIEQYLHGIRKHLQGNLKVMSSAGSLVGAAHFRPKDSLLSGPAGGIVGAAEVAKRYGLGKVISFDMGGTSTDVARYTEGFNYVYEQQVGDAKLLAPGLSIHTVAAGGGSLCQFDGHKLRVGPESAGAHPGPACYGIGQQLAITDINLLLGRLDPESFGIPISVKKAEKVLDDMLLQMQGAGHQATKTEVLMGLLQIANEKMAEAIRRVSVREGHDPEAYTLVGFGGAGGQHVCAVAELLQISEVIVPYHASLLSAWGMGEAQLARFANRQLLQPWEIAAAQLNETFAELRQEATAELLKEGFAESATEIAQEVAFIRFKGQEHALEVAWQGNPTETLQLFERHYRQLYGHWLPDRTVEVVSLKVQATSKNRKSASSEEKIEAVPALEEKRVSCLTEKGREAVPFYRWEAQQMGARLQGPALFSSGHTAIWVAEGWELQLTHTLDARLQRTETTAQRKTQQPEAVKLELFTNRFASVAATMGAMLERTAFSVNVKDRMDFSCALLDPQGELVVNAPHIPVHLGSMGLCVRKTLEKLPLQQGDVVITNHPGFGGSHLPDVTLIAPVFTIDGKTLLGYVANRAHHAEIGGKSPGSMPTDAQNLAEEGVVIAPTYLVKNGAAQWDAIEKLLKEAPYPSRSVPENLADLRAGLASLEAGKQQLQSLAAEFGAATVAQYMQQLKNYAAQLMAECLATLPHQPLEATELLDDGHRLCVRLERMPQNRLHIDFSGTSAVHPGNFNATPAIVNSAVIYVLRLLLHRDFPLNEGLLQHVDIHLPTSLLNPDFQEDDLQNPAVVGGNTEVSQRLVDALLKALGLSACSQGTMNNLLFGNEQFGYYETIGGGAGAGNGFGGASAVHQHMTNTRITDPELLEFRYPVQLRHFAIRKGSGGRGKWSGGEGIIRELEARQPLHFTLLTQHREQAPYGLEGGEAGKTGINLLLRADGQLVQLGCVASVALQPGDAIRIETPGGGGYGAEGC